MNKKEIIISSYSGFCFGVRRALDIADKALKEHVRVYSLGPIIHNGQVVEEFSKKGLKITRGIKRLKMGKGAVLIPSHGVSPDFLKGKKFTLVDTTCPLVRKVQKVLEGLVKKGYYIIIVGNRFHPEVRGLIGITGKKKLAVVKDKKEARLINFPSGTGKVAVIAQTTASVTDFKEVVSEIAKKDFAELVSLNTVCRNTVERVKEALQIAEKVDAMIVIGGKESANTTKLARTCRRANRHTYHIETTQDLKRGFFKNKKRIGIATGASTPPYAIRDVIKKLGGLN